jgi:hypothetical protein
MRELMTFIIINWTSRGPPGQPPNRIETKLLEDSYSLPHLFVLFCPVLNKLGC